MCNSKQSSHVKEEIVEVVQGGPQEFLEGIGEQIDDLIDGWRCMQETVSDSDVSAWW